MGFWSKVAKVGAVVTQIAPVLPISDKAKQAIADGAKVEADVEALVKNAKAPPPEKPAA